jgi:hypothetical protein
MLGEPVASIQEIRKLKITPRFRVDYPQLDVAVTMRVLITARSERREAKRGVRTAAVRDEYVGLGTFALDCPVWT